MLATTFLVVRREVFGGQTAAAGVQRADRALRNWNEISGDGHRMGGTNPKLTIVEFADFECPACRQFFPVIESFRARHPKDVAFVFRHWPLPYHRFAYPSARASECAAAQGRFAEFYGELYRKQDSLGLVQFRELARNAGVENLNEFDKCSGSSDSVKTISSDLALAKAMKAWGTPTVIVNGVLLSETPDQAKLEGLLAAAK